MFLLKDIVASWDRRYTSTKFFCRVIVHNYSKHYRSKRTILISKESETLGYQFILMNRGGLYWPRTFSVFPFFVVTRTRRGLSVFSSKHESYDVQKLSYTNLTYSILLQREYFGPSFPYFISQSMIDSGWWDGNNWNSLSTPFVIIWINLGTSHVTDISTSHSSYRAFY